MAVGYLNSTDLINTVIREGMIPTSQSTFTNADFLSIANQEMRIGLVPAIMQYHQEYYARDSVPIPIVANQNNYPIPYRAIGGKFRELFYLDVNNNLRSMTRVNPDDRPYYQQTNFQNRFVFYYIKGNDVVLMPDVGSNPVGSLVFTFYMRPNELVDMSTNPVSTIQSITTTNLSGSLTDISVANPTVLTSTNHGLATGNIITISGSNSTPIINGNYAVTVVDANTFTIPVNVTVQGTQGNWAYKTTIYTVDQVPTTFSTSTKLDLLQTNPGHQTINFDIVPLSVNTQTKQIQFQTTDTYQPTYGTNIGTTAIVGDYIALAGQCIIPQAPSDLHDVLSQRVLQRVLQALGDQEGVGLATQKLSEMEKYTGMLVDNRSEGNPTKINNLSGALRQTKLRRRGWV